MIDILCSTCDALIGTMSATPTSEALSYFVCPNGHHQPGWINPEVKQIAIHDYLTSSPLDKTIPPMDIDFSVASTVELHKQVEAQNQGDITRIVYYANRDNSTGTYSTPVVQRDFAITYPSDAFRVEVEETLSWHYRDGSLCPHTKVLNRYYGLAAGQNPLGAASADLQRYFNWMESKREQIIAWLRSNVASAMMVNLLPQGWSTAQIVAEGGDFFHSYSALIYSYETGYDHAFPAAVQADSTHAWLDGSWPTNPSMTIRQVFQQQLIYS